jgi:DNA-binding response OmpR family regulator
MTVLTASNETDALTQFRIGNGDLDLVIIDHGIPSKDGTAVYKELRTIDPAVPLMIASSHVNPVVRSQLLKDGIEQIIEKPRDTKELAGILQMHFSRTKREGAAGKHIQ